MDNVMKNGQDMNMIKKEVKVNCKEDYGKIKIHLFASSQKNANVVKNGYFFSMVIKTYFDFYNLLNICNKYLLMGENPLRCTT
jgi:hypothetical protein